MTKLLNVRIKGITPGYDERDTLIVLNEEDAKRVAFWIEKELIDFVYDFAEAGWEKKVLKVTLEE